MTLNRRDFSAVLVGKAFSAAALPLAVQAAPQASARAPVEGVNYVRLEKPAQAVTPGRIDVIEFF